MDRDQKDALPFSEFSESVEPAVAALQVQMIEEVINFGLKGEWRELNRWLERRRTVHWSKTVQRAWPNKSET